MFRLFALLLCALTLTTPLRAQDLFFPPGVWEEEGSHWTAEEQGRFYEDWFGQQLAAMGEAPMWQFAAHRPRPGLSFRLLVLPTLDPATMIRLDQSPSGGVEITVTRLNGAGGYEPGVVEFTETTMVPEAKFERLQNLLSAVLVHVPSPPSREFKPGFVRFCADGTTLVFELHRHTEYHVTTRHRCNLLAPNPLRYIAKQLDDLSDGVHLRDAYP